MADHVIVNDPQHGRVWEGRLSTVPSPGDGFVMDDVWQEDREVSCRNLDVSNNGLVLWVVTLKKVITEADKVRVRAMAAGKGAG